MNVAAVGLGVFAAGAAYEALAVGWVHFASRGLPVLTALCSGLQAACQLTGLVEAVHDVRTAPCFVAGYAVGAYAGVLVQRAVNAMARRRGIAEPWPKENRDGSS